MLKCNIQNRFNLPWLNLGYLRELTTAL